MQPASRQPQASGTDGSRSARRRCRILGAVGEDVIMPEIEEPQPPSPEVLLGLRLIPKWGSTLAQYVIDKHEQQVRRLTEMLESTGYEPDDLFRAANANERLSDLVKEAIESAASTSIAEKRRLLGRALAQAIDGDDAVVDRSEAVLRALVLIEPPHVRLMSKMLKPTMASDFDAEDIDLRLLEERDPGIGSLAGPLLLQLTGWGLTETVISSGRYYYKLTNLGLSLTLDLLIEAGDIHEGLRKTF